MQGLGFLFFDATWDVSELLHDMSWSSGVSFFWDENKSKSLLREG